MQQNSSTEIIIAKFPYHAQDPRELSVGKNERLLLLDDSCQWWKVKRVESDETGYIPSNFARREKRSLLDKIISKRLHKRAPPAPTNGYHPEQVLSLALVKFRYDAGSEDEISLNKGLWVNVLDKKNDGWWFVQFDQQRGWFPSNYLIEKNNDGTNSLSLINQLKSQNSSSSSTNGLSSSSSDNSNLVDHDPTHSIPTANRHNSHPIPMNNGNDEYAFVIKPSKFAHSDGRLDACLIFNNSPSSSTTNNQPKNSSWSAFTPPSSLMQTEPISLVDGLAGLTIKANQTPSEQSPYEQELWYYGSISRDDAERCLKADEIQRGDFLIRNSERKIGHYSLSIRADQETIRHFRIETTDDGKRFLIGKRAFPSLHELIEHYQTHPVFDADPSSKLYLNQPFITRNSIRQQS